MLSIQMIHKQEGLFQQWWIICIFLCLLIALLTKHHAKSWNDLSRMATIQSLVENKTLVIDHSMFAHQTEDKAFIKRHFYSDKPVMLSLMGAAIYLPLYTSGISFKDNLDLTYFVITLFTVGLAWLLCMTCFYNALLFTGIKDRTRILITFSLALGTILFPWSTVFNNHSVAASLIFIGFFFFIKARFLEERKFINVFLAGFFLSLGGTIDVPSLLFYVAFLALILSVSELRKYWWVFILPGILTNLPDIIINYNLTHSLIPICIRKDLHDFRGSYWLRRSAEVAGVRINSPAFLVNYTFNALIGKNGFFLYNPLFSLSFICLIKEILQKRKFWKEALVVFFSSIVIISYYLLSSTNYGGNSYSIRWFVPLIPICFFFIYNFFERMNFKKDILLTVLLVLSFSIAVVGLYNPWTSKKDSASCSFTTNVRKIYRAYFKHQGHKKEPINKSIAQIPVDKSESED